MVKKTYYKPMILPLEPGDDPGIILPPSQGTSGEDPQYTWDPEIDPDYYDLFWLSYDETDLPGIDTNGDQYISLAEFQAWMEAEDPF